MYLRIWIAQLTLSALTKRTAPSLWFLSPRGTSDSARLCTSENGNRQASLGRGRNTPPPPHLHSQFPSAESLAQVPYYLSCTEEGKYFQQLSEQIGHLEYCIKSVFCTTIEYHHLWIFPFQKKLDCGSFIGVLFKFPINLYYILVGDMDNIFSLYIF